MYIYAVFILEEDFYSSTIELMLEKESLISKQDSKGNTPIFIATERSDVNHETFSILLNLACKRKINK